MGGQRVPKPEPGSLGSLCLYLGLGTFGLRSIFTRVRYLCSFCQRMGLGRLPLAWMACTRAISWATSLEGATETWVRARDGAGDVLKRFLKPHPAGLRPLSISAASR